MSTPLPLKMPSSSASTPSPVRSQFQLTSPSRHLIQTESTGLYVVLGDLGDTIRWHWGLYLAYTPRHGRLMHWSNPKGDFRYESAVKEDMTIFENVILMLKVGEIEDFMQGALVERVGKTQFWHGEDNCKTWLLRTLTELDNEGWITLTKNADAVEKEAMDWAFEKTSRRQRGAEKSRYSMDSV